MNVGKLELTPISIACLIGSFFALACQPAHAVSCHPQVLQQKLDHYASVAGSLLNPSDKSIVLNAVASYPEGPSPPSFKTLSDGQPQVIISSRAAAFYMAGVDAILQDNKLVAGWAFVEAARRNPKEPSFLNNVAFILLQYKLYDDARMVLECTLFRAPDFTSANVNLGYALGNLGDHGTAAKRYLNAVINNPGRADYLYLAANEYAKAGSFKMAELLADMGSNLSSSYDFTALLNALPPSAQPPSCPSPEPLSLAVSSNSAYLDFLLDAWPAARLKEYITPLNDYQSKVLAPRLDNALLTKQKCGSSRQTELTTCRDNCLGEPLCLATCDCMIEPRIEQCELTRAHSEYSAYVDAAGFENGLLGAWFVREQSLLTQYQPQLVGNWRQVLGCRVAESDRDAVEAFWFETETNLTASAQDISNSRSNVNQTIEFFCNRSISTWLLTGGPVYGLEEKWCLGPVCFSYDATSQTVGVSAAFLLAGKLTKNLVTGEWGFNVGVGMQFGVGELNAGGALYLKFAKGKAGFEPKVTFGPFEGGYYFGLEALDVPLGQYAPVIP